MKSLSNPRFEHFSFKNQIYYAKFSEKSGPLFYPPHYHPQMEIFIPFGFEGQITIAGNTYNLIDGDFYIIPVNCIHSFRFHSIKEKGHHYNFMFNLGRNETWLDKITTENGATLIQTLLNLPIHHYQDNGTWLQDLLQLSKLRIKPEASTGSNPLETPLRDGEIILRFFRRLTEISKGKTTIKSLHPSVQRAIDVSQTMALQITSLSEIAKQCGLSKFHLCRLFKKEVGTSLQQHIIQLRIDHACSLLLNNAKNISEICFDSGFQNISYFIKVFRRFTGESPKQWRTSRQTNPLNQT